MKEIKVNYELTEEDFIKYNMYSLEKGFKKSPAAIIIVIILIFLVLLQDWNTWGIVLMSVWILFFVSIANPLVMKKVLKIYCNRFLKNKENSWKIIWTISVSLNKDNFTNEKNWAKSITPWKNLILEENKDYIFLYTTSITAHIIPKQKIMPEEKREEAIDFIKERFVEK